MAAALILLGVCLTMIGSCEASQSMKQNQGFIDRKSFFISMAFALPGAVLALATALGA